MKKAQPLSHAAFPLRGRSVTLRLCVAAFALVLVTLPAKASYAASLSGLLRREGSLLTTLESNVRSLVEHDAVLARLEHQQRGADYEIGETERRIEALSERLVDRRKQLRQRLVALYKLSQGGYARLLVDSPDRDDALRRVAAIKRLVQRDAAELSQHQHEHAQIERLRAQLAGKRRQRAQLIEQEQVRRDDLKRQLRTSRKALRRVRANRRARQQLRRELSVAQRALLRRVSRLRAKVHAAAGFAAQRGRLARPVRGWVASRFGRARAARARLSVSRSGITIRCGRRASVRAVQAGIVRLSQQVDGYGHVVLLDHGEGYFSLSGFLARVTVQAGQQVKRGARIGLAGRDPLSGRSALYFELRRHEQALDPLPWLQGA